MKINTICSFLLFLFLFSACCKAENHYDNWLNGQPSSIGTREALCQYSAEIQVETKEFCRLKGIVGHLDRDEGVLRSALLKDYLHESKGTNESSVWPLLAESRRHTAKAMTEVSRKKFINKANSIDHVLEAILTLDMAEKTLSFSGLESIDEEQSSKRAIIHYGLRETRALYGNILKASDVNNPFVNQSLMNAGGYIEKAASGIGMDEPLTAERASLLVQFLSAALYELTTAAQQTSSLLE